MSEVCEQLLKTVHAVDNHARISAVARREDDESTLVRLRLSSRLTDAAKLTVTSALNAVWPLASVSLVENVVDGTVETQVLLPSASHQNELARERVHMLPHLQKLVHAARLCAMVGVVAFLVAAIVGGLR
jgi:hypothetical protein